jgi:hypothetical protein
MGSFCSMFCRNLNLWTLSVVALLFATMAWAVQDTPVIAVTDMTDEGRKRPTASPESPIYYQAVTTGYQVFGRGVASEQIPPHDVFLQVVLKTLKKEGFIPATDENPPSIVLGFSWGSVWESEATALQVLGGDKLDLTWENKATLGLEPRQWLRGLRKKNGDRIVEMSKENLFVVNISAYDRPALIKGDLLPLWQTRIACPTRGVWAKDAMPKIVIAAASVIGRETEVPQISTVSEAFGQRGEVSIGDLTVTDDDFDLKTLPVLDLTKESRN